MKNCVHLYENNSPFLLRKGNVSEKFFREKQNAQFMFNNIPV
jgi:hypothetical protein